MKNQIDTFTVIKKLERKLQAIALMRKHKGKASAASYREERVVDRILSEVRSGKEYVVNGRRIITPSGVVHI